MKMGHADRARLMGRWKGSSYVEEQERSPCPAMAPITALNVRAREIRCPWRCHLPSHTMRGRTVCHLGPVPVLQVFYSTTHGWVSRAFRVQILNPKPWSSESEHLGVWSWNPIYQLPPGRFWRLARHGSPIKMSRPHEKYKISGKRNALGIQIAGKTETYSQETET